MMAIKINIAYNIGFFQSGMELDGINGRTLPDLDDLYVIRCEMTCRLQSEERVSSYLVHSLCYGIFDDYYQKWHSYSISKTWHIIYLQDLFFM